MEGSPASAARKMALSKEIALDVAAHESVHGTQRAFAAPQHFRPLPEDEQKRFHICSWPDLSIGLP